MIGDRSSLQAVPRKGQTRQEAQTRPEVRCTELTFPDGSSPDHRANRVLLVGTGQPAVRIAGELLSAHKPYVVVGSVDSSPQSDLNRKFHQIPNLGDFSRLKSSILDFCADEVHVALPLRAGHEEIESMHRACKELGIPIIFHLSLSGDPKSEPASTDSTQVMACFNRHRANTFPYRWAKRGFDLTVATLALILSAPLWVLIALSIKLTSRGPVFFRQQRIGQGRRCFGMWKFRTMLPNAEELRHEVAAMNNARGISFKVFRDPRVTAIGALLRRSSLDELPQIFNVLTGEMSLMGPRPIPVWVGEQLEQAAFFRRFCVKPGLTGLWQVEGREQDFDWMATQDLRYVDHWSLWLDLKIMFKTLPAVVKGEGAH